MLVVQKVLVREKIPRFGNKTKQTEINRTKDERKNLL